MAEAAAIFKAEIVSKTTIKPSTPTPSHLHHFKVSLLDQLAPPSFYVPIVLFYSASDLHHHHDFTQISQNLKSSLSQVLTLYYPFCGRINDSSNGAAIPYVDCNDDDGGVVYLEARIPSTLSDLLTKRNHPQIRDQIQQFLPLDPYNQNDDVAEHDRGDEVNHSTVMMGVQVSEFKCGSVAVGACISHRVCDGATMASFLEAWSEIARTGDCDGVPVPIMEGSVMFPAREMQMNTASGMTGERNIATRRMVLSGESLCRLRESVGGDDNDTVTKVEAVTALIWKSAAEAAAAGGGGPLHSSYASMVSHAVNIRRRMVPTLPDNAIGNLWQIAVSPLVEIDKGMEIEVQDLAQVVRKTIRKIDGDYVRKLRGDDGAGVYEVLKSIKEVMFLVAKRGIPCYSFSSWTRFGFYETDFGLGKPTWVCTIGVPIRNVVVLMPTKSGDGVEAWVTLNDLHMAQFENNPLLLQFASFDP